MGWMCCENGRRPCSVAFSMLLLLHSGIAVTWRRMASPSRWNQLDWGWLHSIHNGGLVLLDPACQGTPFNSDLFMLVCRQRSKEGVLVFLTCSGSGASAYKAVPFEVLAPALLNLLEEEGRNFEFPAKDLVHKMRSQRLAKFSPEAIYGKDLFCTPLKHFMGGKTFRLTGFPIPKYHIWKYEGLAISYLILFDSIH